MPWCFLSMVEWSVVLWSNVLPDCTALRGFFDVLRDDLIQMSRINRLGQVGITARHLSLDTVEGRSLAGQHDDGRLFAVDGFFYYAASGVIAIHARHEHIHQDAVEG